MEFVDRKFVIYVGKKTVNSLCFKKGSRPVAYSQKTLSDEETIEFFKSNKLNDTYMKAVINAINSFIDVLQEDCSKDEISIYAASEFRTNLDENAIIYFKMRIFEATGVHAFILTKNLEQLYIKNLVPACTQNRMILRIMSTATVIYLLTSSGEMIEIRYEDLGTATIARKLCKIKSCRKKIHGKMSDLIINEILKELEKIISDAKVDILQEKMDMAIYLGGEIDFLKELQYALEENTFFKDEEHPYALTYGEFYRQSVERVLKKEQKDLDIEAVNLEKAWKEGIKPCTLIAIAVFRSFGIKTIIPSNKKEFFGMYYKNFEKVVLTGSQNKNGKEIEDWIEYFQSRGISVYSPHIHDSGNANNQIMEEAFHLQSINQCDTLIVCNSSDDGYIGDSTLFDVGYALAKEKRVIATRKPQKDLFQQIAVEIGIYEGN